MSSNSRVRRACRWLLFAATLSLAPVAYAPGAAGADEEALACFFEGPRFTGASFCARPGIETPDAAGVRLSGQRADWSRRICSVQVIGGAAVTVWDGAGFSGSSLTLRRSEFDLRSVRTKAHGVRNWCRVVTSYKVHD